MCDLCQTYCETYQDTWREDFFKFFCRRLWGRLSEESWSFHNRSLTFGYCYKKLGCIVNHCFILVYCCHLHSLHFRQLTKISSIDLTVIKVCPLTIYTTVSRNLSIGSNLPKKLGTRRFGWKLPVVRWRWLLSNDKSSYNSRV